MIDFTELGDNEENEALARKYEKALEHRDKLIDYDDNSAKRLGVVDESTDWYDLSKNAWITKDQRNYAQIMLDAEKKRAEQIDEQMAVDINLETGKIDLRVDERDNAFAFA